MQPRDQTVPIVKRDLIQAWSVLERLAVSLQKIGSHFATAGPDVPLSASRRRQMLEELDAFFSSALYDDIAKARRALCEYLDHDEGEMISDQLEFWQPRRSRKRSALGK